MHEKEYHAVPQINIFPVRQLLHFGPEVYHWDPTFFSNRDTCLRISTSYIICPLRQTRWILNIRMSASNSFSRWNALHSQFKSYHYLKWPMIVHYYQGLKDILQRKLIHDMDVMKKLEILYARIIPEAPFFINWGRSYEKNLSLWPSLLNPKEFFFKKKKSAT
jgi:hypothetical protein